MNVLSVVVVSIVLAKLAEYIDAGTIFSSF
jgi:hypothetical protein